MIFKLNDRTLNFKLDGRVVGFKLTNGVLNFKLNASVEVTPDEGCLRLLETGFYRLLENGSRRLLEECGEIVVAGDNTLDATLDFTL